MQRSCLHTEGMTVVVIRRANMRRACLISMLYEELEERDVYVSGPAYTARLGATPLGATPLAAQQAAVANALLLQQRAAMMQLPHHQGKTMCSVVVFSPSCSA